MTDGKKALRAQYPLCKTWWDTTVEASVCLSTCSKKRQEKLRGGK